MSDFRLHQIAPFLEKDAKTLRRWCEAGVVPPLELGEPVGCYRTQGGHWRISGGSSEEVVAFLCGRIPKTSRRRKENTYPLAGDRTKPPREAWATALPGAWRWSNLESPRVHATPWGCIGNQSTPAEKHRFLEAVAKGHLDSAQNLTEWIHANGEIKNLESLPEPLTAEKLAFQCGVSRRTFYRWFPGWRRAVQKLVVAGLRKKLFDETGAIVAGDEGIDFADMDARNGWRDLEATGTTQGGGKA